MNKQKIGLIILLSLSLSMLGVTTIQAQTIQDSYMCYGYGATDLQPKGVGNTIFTYTEQIGFWVQIQNPADVSYRMIWTDPNGNQFRNTAVEVIEKSGTDWGIVFDSIKIAETTAKNKLGVWTVSLYVDGEVMAEGEFQIIDYDALIETFSGFSDQLDDLIDEKDTILAQKAAVEASLAALQADYAALEASVGTTSDYEELQDNYNDLNDDYEALKASQGTTKMMMYASIVVALIAVVVAVYFGVMKK